MVRFPISAAFYRATLILLFECRRCGTCLSPGVYERKCGIVYLTLTQVFSCKFCEIFKNIFKTRSDIIEFLNFLLQLKN